MGRCSVKVLITNFRLSERTAPELFVRDVARILHAGGVEVAVFASRLGPLAEELRAQGILVAAHPFVQTFKPDVIHGQGNLEAMAAILGHPGVPGVFLSHGPGPWRDAPPRHPRIHRYLATTHRVRTWLRKEGGLPAEQVVALPDLLSADRLGEPKRVPVKPETALYCDSFPESAGAEGWLRQVCQELGLRLDTVSGLVGKTPVRARDLFPRYDLVFASGRTVLEALAAGCGVVPVSRGTFGDLVTVNNLERGAENDFSERRPVKAGSGLVAELVAEIDTWDWRNLDPLASKVRGRHGEEPVRRHLLEIYETVLSEAASHRTNARSELPLIASWLLGLSEQHHQLDLGYLVLEQRTNALRTDQQRADADAQELASQLEMEKEKVRLVRRLLREGNVFHRGLRRRIEEGWRDIEQGEGLAGSPADGSNRRPGVDLSA